MIYKLILGGKLILEAQGFNGYKKRKNLTPRIRQNFDNIGLRPENFYDYLLHEVSFTIGETIAIPTHTSQGFQRPLQVKRILKNFIDNNVLKLRHKWKPDFS